MTGPRGDDVPHTRNSLTHLDPHSYKPIDGARLRTLTSFLNILLTACLLRELGLEPDEVATTLTANRSYQFEISQIRAR